MKFLGRSQNMVWKRFLMLLPTVFFISMVSFFLIFYSPGDMARLILQERLHAHQVAEEDVQDFAQRKGLNVSSVEMYFSWLKGIAKGDFGCSLITNEPVLDIIRKAFSKTIFFAIFAFSIQVFFGFLLGFRAAWREGGWADRMGDHWSLLSMSVPPYWFALLVLWFCAARLKWNFVLGYHGPISFLAPAFVMGSLGAGWLFRVVKSKVSLVLQETYIEYAIAQGIPGYRIFFGHVFKNALSPILPTLTHSFVGLLGGSLFMEKIFSIPGIGLLAFRALESKDIFLLSGIVFYTAMVATGINFISDLICIRLDRRSDSELYQR